MLTFLTRNEIMEILRISPSSLTRYMKDGLPYIKLRGRVLFSSDKIEDFMKEFSFNYTDKDTIEKVVQ